MANETLTDPVTGAAETINSGGAALVMMDPTRRIASRAPSGRVVFVEDFRNPNPSFFNDAVGGASRDCEIMFGGCPSFRLDPMTNTQAGTVVAAPGAPVLTPNASGGSFASGTYFYKITATNLVGETTGGTEASVSVATNGSVSLSWTAVDGATGYNVYRGTTTNTETYLGSTTGHGSTTTLDVGAATTAATVPGSNTTTSPGRTVSTSGVVAKRRIHDPFTGRFGVEMWFRFSSTNLTSNVWPTIDLYNRDGTSAWHTRVWLNPMGNNQPMQAWILDGTATAGALASPLTGTPGVWRSVVTSAYQNGGGTHTYDPVAGGLDRAGGWHYVKLVADMRNKTYVSVNLDGIQSGDLTGYAMDQTTTSGFAGMHFSADIYSSTSTRRFMNIAQVVGTRE